MNQETIPKYSKAIIKLLKGTVNKTDKIWIDVLNYQVEIQNYLSQIGLNVIVKEDDGYAYLKQFVDEDGKTLGLSSRRKIGYETSIVLVVLRAIIEDFDANPDEIYQVEKIITLEELKEEIALFLPDSYNQIKFDKGIDSYINKVVELGYLKELESSTSKKYKVHPIIKEKITLDTLNEFKEKLENYASPTKHI
ncbi:MAG: DUF4194 domain-containing protein [Gammaproteobacteria bacterium]|nr:DUF4194 domain-containing protein [Gammaproteobacteria bacterium]